MTETDVRLLTYPHALPAVDPLDESTIRSRLHRFHNLTEQQIDGLVLFLDPAVVDAISDEELAAMVTGMLPNQPLQPGGGMPLGMPGAQTLTRYAGGTDSGAPTLGAFHAGDFVIAADGHVFVCVEAGTPGTWVDTALADIVASTPDATTSTKGLVRLAGDLAGTASSPTVPGLASKADSTATVLALAGKQATANPTAVKTGAYTAAANDLIPVDTTSGPVTITLPATSTDKTRVTVKHVVQGGSNAVTIAAGGSDVFNKTGGSTSLTLTTLNQAMTVQYQATSGIWYVVNDSLTPSAVQALLSGTFVPQTALAASLGVATLDASSLVVQNPKLHASRHAPGAADDLSGSYSKLDPQSISYTRYSALTGLPMQVPGAQNTYGKAAMFGNTASFGNSGSPPGSPEAFAPFVVHQRYGDAAGLTNADVLKQTQGAYFVTEYYGRTTEDAAEGISSGIFLADTGTAFTQDRQVTAIEADAQVSGANQVSSSGYVLGVGARISAAGTSNIVNAYGVKASAQTSLAAGGYTGSITNYTAFKDETYNPATGLNRSFTGANPILSEQAFFLSRSGYGGQATLDLSGGTPTANQSMLQMILPSPSTTRTVTDGAIASGSNQLNSTAAAWSIPADIGKKVTVVGAGVSGANLITRVASAIGNVATLVTAASSTVASASVTIAEPDVRGIRIIGGAGQTQAAFEYWTNGASTYSFRVASTGFVASTQGYQVQNSSNTPQCQLGSLGYRSLVSNLETSGGSGTASLGSNCPAVTPGAPYKWLTAQTSDGSTVYFPTWK